MKKRYYILTGVLSYLFFALSNVPAAKIVSLVQENSQLPVKLYGVYGSLWNGRANTAMLQGQPPIKDFQWSVNPAALLLAQISADVKGSINEQNITGNVSIGITGNISASDVRARIDAAVIQQMVTLPMGELGGFFNIDIASLETGDEGLPIVDASIKWKNAKFTLLDTVNLGHVSLDISPGEDNQLVAKISNKKGELSLDGSAQVDAKKAYNLELSIIPEKSAQENIRQSLTMFAKRQTDGSYLVKRRGNLKDLGL
ncbi:hypothetical protein MNBD_GAMMA11-802 [hydrothermal vent metagenome]|uniref:General secretion pathway protein N n=1 Tax=hydrothermal vent metagenome TaxID=652676 RepID=A0A3B0XHG2_9ZZZZ